jgi:hypothetical protein
MRFEGLTKVNIKIRSFSDVIPCTTMYMEIAGFSETLVRYYQTTLRHMSEHLSFIYNCSFVNFNLCVGFVVHTTLVTNVAIFWDTASCSSCMIQRFREHITCTRVSCSADFRP